MTIKKLAEFQAGIFEDAAKTSANHGMAYVDMNAHLLGMAEKGDIAEGLIREEWVAAGISPVRQLLHAEGITLGGLNATKCDVFFRGNANSIKGADVVFPILLQEMFEGNLGINAGAGDLTMTSRPGVAGDTLYPLDMRPPVDQRLPYPENVVTIDDLVSLTVGIDGDGYKAAQINRVDGATTMGRVAEGADLPLYEIKLGDNVVRVYKYGARVKFTYEALRRQRINQLAVLMQNMAYDEYVRRILAALDVARNGDGNGNAAVTTNAAGAWTIQSIDEFGMGVAYNARVGLDRYVGDLTEVQGTRALCYASTGAVTLNPDQLAMYTGMAYQMPDGSPLKLAPKGSLLDGSKTLLGWNAARALEQVIENGSQIQEQARQISNQTQEFTMSINIGYAKPWANSFQAFVRP
ncbi:phage major capsid protein [Deinococcus alpinitundrae]|uniref:phage major capsid protein n=1 Tax=Deinococcus alpinitundrae TaxID=468913 RepID=UPI001379FDFF|nr:hypothetical protein [Deinococcus alpinitundrae]